MTRPALPNWLEYDAVRDELVVYGVRYSAQALAHLGLGPVGTVFRVVRRESGTLTIETLGHAPAAPAPHDARMELWARVCAAVASATDCKNPLVPTTWADTALARFDKQFPIKAST